jgi:hypothetical protein
MKYTKLYLSAVMLLAPLGASANLICSGLGVLYGNTCSSSVGVLTGSSGNYDIANDTDHPAVGFDMDYPGMSSAQVGYTWDYSRFGKPTVSEYIDSTGLKHALVHYQATFSNGKWSTATPNIVGGNWGGTNGHQCAYSYTPITNDPCEHFVAGNCQCSCRLDG